MYIYIYTNEHLCVYIYTYTRALKVPLIKFMNLDPLSDANWRVLSNSGEKWHAKHRNNMG